ncbi:hypothetical protein [Streptomyces uncialis]|uniref:hypothetical protein n=1 Tax=Streptomyces uncialis TaxID=1048205 RepID=UPI002250640F|nr:hypothetical protein [Streptomyces uncialis]MCX4662074.1 hypothetical protein [Streptomyces uncialis]
MGTVLKGRGSTFRLEDGAVRIVRGRASWQVPWDATADPRALPDTAGNDDDASRSRPPVLAVAGSVTP